MFSNIVKIITFHTLRVSHDKVLSKGNYSKIISKPCYCLLMFENCIFYKGNWLKTALENVDHFQVLYTTHCSCVSVRRTA